MSNKHTKVKIRLLLLFLASVLFINSVKAQEIEEDDTPIKVDTLLLTMPFTVADKSGRNIAGLKKENFSIFQKGEE